MVEETKFNVYEGFVLYYDKVAQNDLNFSIEFNIHNLKGKQQIGSKQTFMLC